MSKSENIARIHAREVLDSRGNPTVEVEVFTESGVSGRAIVPSGASTGRHEAVELRDGDPSHFGGKGVRKAVRNICEQITPAIIGSPVTDRELIDRTMIELDGTPNKSNLGANAILGVSLSCAQTGAAVRGQPLWQYLDPDGHASMPMPMVNLISGGLHAGGKIEFQDFLLLPIGARSYSESLQMAVAVYRTLGEVLHREGYESALVGDEGGYGPKLNNNEQAVEMILKAFTLRDLKPNRDAAIALDVAATHFYRDGEYHLDGRTLSSGEMATLLDEWTQRYPILSIEDGLAEDDWAGWQELTRTTGERAQLIGDDLFVTNPTRLQKGIESGAANSVLVKVNQIGTLTEALIVIDQARTAGYHTVVSARSGETEDTTIADLAVATGAGQIKIGSIVRSERLAKYNQLLRIEEQIGTSRFARFPIERSA